MPMPPHRAKGRADAARVLLEADRSSLVDRKRWDTRLSCSGGLPSERSVDGASSLPNGLVPTQPRQEMNLSGAGRELLLPTPSLLSHSAQADVVEHCGDLRASPTSSSSHPLPSYSTANHDIGYPCNPMSHSCSSHGPNSMQWRLCLLEERVSRIAEELTGTKDLLDAFNPAWSKALLAEIQSKISIIETAMILQTAPDSAMAAENEKGEVRLGGVEVFKEDFVSEIKSRKGHSQVPFQTCCELNLEESSSTTSCGPPIFLGEDGAHGHSCCLIGHSDQHPFSGDPAGSDPSGRQKTNSQANNRADAFHRGSIKSSFGNGRSDKSNDIMLDLPTQADVSTGRATNVPMDAMCSLQKNFDGPEASTICGPDLIKAAAERRVVCSSADGQREFQAEKRGGNNSRTTLTDSESLGLGVCSNPGGENALEDASRCTSSREPAKSSQYYLSQMVASSNSLLDSHVHPLAKNKIMEKGTQSSSQLQKDSSSSADLTSQANEGEMLRTWQEFSHSDDAQYGEALLPLWTSRPIFEHQNELTPSEPNPGLFKLGQKLATAGWFVCEGEGIVLAHEDGACTYYDVANMEEKAEFRCPIGMSAGGWDDCWLIRAAGADGRSNKYVVRASVPGGSEAGFCVWNFEDKKATTYHSESSSFLCSKGKGALYRGGHLFEQETLGPASTAVQTSKTYMNLQHSKLKSVNSILDHGIPTLHPQPPLWWYRPCGPLLASAGSSQSTLILYDIRDGDIVTKWNSERSIMASDISSPLQWRNKGKLVVGVEEGIGIWDVNSMAAHCLQSISFSGQNIHALHIPNADAECSGGVWQRRSVTEGSKGDGVVCTQHGLHVLDFRLPSGVAYKMTSTSEDTQCVYVNGDFIFSGVSIGTRDPGDLVQHKVVQWSFRHPKPICFYGVPGLAAPKSLRQVWGSTETVMTADSNGLFVFNSEGTRQQAKAQNGEPEVIGASGLFRPNFDYASSRILLISRDRPASWCHWPQ